MPLFSTGEMPRGGNAKLREIARCEVLYKYFYSLNIAALIELLLHHHPTGLS
jgi:hypothetical protein